MFTVESNSLPGMDDLLHYPSAMPFRFVVQWRLRNLRKVMGGIPVIDSIVSLAAASSPFAMAV